MSDESLFRYRLKCTTENTSKYVWRSESQGPPTVCPDNSADTIDTESIVVVDTRVPDLVELKEETIPTGGNFRVDGVTWDIEGGSPESDIVFDVGWATPVSILNLQLLIANHNVGDNFTMIVNPETLAGVVTGVIGSPANRIPVSSTVIENAKIGYSIILDNGVIKEDLGRIVEIDTENSEVFTENAPENSFSPGTFIRMHRVGIDQLYLPAPYVVELGANKVGATHLPLGTVIRTIYKNNDGQPKNFSVVVEYLF